MNKRVVFFIILPFLMTFCSPSETDFDKRAKKYLAKNMAEWFIRSPLQNDKIICCHDGQVLEHNLKSNSDSLIYSSRNRALTLTAERDSVFYFTDEWLVYGYDIDQGRLFDVWDEMCSEGVYLTAVNKYILYIKTNDELQDYILAPEDEVIVYNYIEDTRIPLVFKTDKGKTLNRRRLLRSESTFHINIEGGTLLFDRYYNNGSCIEL